MERAVGKKGGKSKQKKCKGKMRIKGIIGLWQMFLEVLAGLFESLLERKGQQGKERTKLKRSNESL